MRPWQTIYDERRPSFEESRIVATSRGVGRRRSEKRHGISFAAGRTFRLTGDEFCIK